MALAAPAAASAASTGGHEPRTAIVVISGDVTVARGETVDGVFVASGDARIAGEVDGDVVVLSGDVLVSGTDRRRPLHRQRRSPACCPAPK